MRSLLTGLLLCVALPGSAELTDSVLGNAGELLSVSAGTYGELFPDGDAREAGRAVLALDVTPADGASTRLLVPGTGDGRVESQPRLLYMPRSDTALVLWFSEGSGDGVRVDFILRGGDDWLDAGSVSGTGGEALLMDRAPHLAATREVFDLELDGETSLSADRTVVHVLSQVSARAHYTPILFMGGSYAGHESFDLSADFFLGSAGAAVETPLAAALGQALHLEVADERRSVTVAFAHPESRRLGALRIGLPPLKLEALGDHVRDQIYARAEDFDPDDVASFSGEIRAELIGVGHRLRMHPGIVDFASEQLGDWLESAASEYGFEGFESLGRDARDLAMYLTGSVNASVVSDPATGDEILEIGLGDFLAALEEASPLAQLLEVEVLADVPAPEIGAGPAAIFASRDGRDLLVGWKPDDKQQVFYVESRSHVDGGAWSESNSLKLGPALTLEDAVRLLEQKIR